MDEIEVDFGTIRSTYLSINPVLLTKTIRLEYDTTLARVVHYKVDTYNQLLLRLTNNFLL